MMSGINELLKLVVLKNQLRNTSGKYEVGSTPNSDGCCTGLQLAALGIIVTNMTLGYLACFLPLEGSQGVFTSTGPPLYQLIVFSDMLLI